MKNIILIIAAALISFTSYSQINLNNTLKSGVNITEISDGNYKYYTVDEKQNIVKFYNLDNTDWKTVKLNVPDDAWLDEVLHISTNKIDENEQIEIVYTTYYETYSDVFEDVESIVYENNNLIIINEEGEELLSIKGGNSFSIINDKKEGTKILIDIYNNNELFTESYTKIYDVDLQRITSKLN